MCPDFLGCHNLQSITSLAENARIDATRVFVERLTKLRVATDGIGITKHHQLDMELSSRAHQRALGWARYYYGALDRTYSRANCPDRLQFNLGTREAEDDRRIRR